MTFRIFTNDRGKQKGIFMYSALTTIEAPNAEKAEQLAEMRCANLAYRGAHGPVKVIEWPPTSLASKQWLAKHVG